jgi:type II secretory pathway component GspD/PulD (secretin)
MKTQSTIARALHTSCVAALVKARWHVFHPRFDRRGHALAAALLLALACSEASAQDQAPAANPPGAPASTTNAPAALAPATNAAATNAAAATADGQGPSDGLRLNFRNAPIDLVLNYLSEAAGFIIELDTPVHGTVSVVSAQPMTKDEAVDLLNSVLNKNGYAAIRTGDRTLKIMDKTTAKSSNNPVKIGNDPSDIPNNDEMVTQIIPIRFVEAAQLVTDISPFVSSGATIIANQAGNSIIITDTQANIKHLAEIIKAIDSSAEDVTELRVFRLQHADPTEMATLLTSLFPDQNSTGIQSPIRFGGRGGRGGFPPFGPFAAMAAAANTGGTANGQSDRVKKRTQVVAVPDPRTSSIVVTATKDLMDQISAMIKDLDFKSDKEQMVKVFHLDNADGQQILPVLQSMFQTSTTSGRSGTTGSSQNSPFQTRLQQYQNSSSSSSSTFGSGLGGGSTSGRGGIGGGGGAGF